MPRIKILRAAEDHVIPVSNGRHSANIPFDGAFHEIHVELIAVLTDSDVDFELENADAPSGSADAGDAAGLGGSAASSPHDDEHIHALASRLEGFADALDTLAVS